MSDWLVRYAQALAEEPLSNDEVAVLLDLARDVAHGAERRFAPLSTFLAGVRVGRQVTGTGADRRAAIDDAIAAAQRLLGDEGGARGAADDRTDDATDR